MNLDDFSVQVDEETRAIKPEVALQEQQDFIGNLRNIQNQQNAEIRQQTHDLGTDIPSNLGGLTGGEGYFNARFQQPFTNAAVGDLRAAAQAQALSEAFDLELARANARYKSAYDAYRKRAGSGGGNNPGGNNPGDSGNKGDVDTDGTEGKNTANIWKDATIGDDKAFYGLLQYNRPEGLSDDEWVNKAAAWANAQSAIRNPQDFLKNTKKSGK